MNTPPIRHSLFRRLALCSLPVIPLGAQTIAPTSPAAGAALKDEVVVLSPFEVISETKGYYSANTMSGTRMNSKLEDLASSVTVMTKEQMQDFAMLDINDIFLYTAGTEGAGTYTAISVDTTGNVTDSVQNNPTQANRVRGIGPANVSLGNFETMSRVPVDPIAVDAVEISRGPNSSVFGLGNPSGTVNQIAASANLTRHRTQVQFRTDSYDGYRSSLDVNHVLKKGVLAIRASAVFQHDGFVRKPSGVDTERYNGMIKYQPFKNTTISASYSYYHSYGTRPTFIPPRDSVSFWIQNGRPTWDPINQVIHVNGQTIGPITSDANLPNYFNRSFTGNAYSYLYVDQGGLSYWQAPISYPNVANGPTGTQSVRLLAASPAAGANQGTFAGQPLFTTTPSVSSKAIYDWSSVNLASVNYDWDRVITPSVQLDQIFFNTLRQTLAAQVGWLREDALRYRRDFIGANNEAGQSGQLLVDVNEKNLDGSPNPFLGRPYIGQAAQRTAYAPAKWDTVRAQLAYRFDFTREKGLLKWLGSHQLTGYEEYKYRINRQYSFRDAIISSHSWLRDGQNTSRANTNAVSGGAGAAVLSVPRTYVRSYVGDNQGQNIDYAPTTYAPGVYKLNWGSYTFANQIVNGQTFSLPVAGSFQSGAENAELGFVAVTDQTGGGQNLKTILKTAGGVIQSHFLDDRLVTTFGKRQDKLYQKNGSTPQLLNPDGMTFNYDSLNHWAAGDYRFNSGKTTTQQYVLRPFRGLSFVNQLAQGGGASGVVGDFMRGLSIVYNKSDSFQPQAFKMNLFFKPLPNPSGTDKSLGFGLNLFEGRLVARFTRYETKQLNKSGGTAETVARRVTRLDASATDPFRLKTQATAWVTAANPAWSAQQVADEVSRQMGMPTADMNAYAALFDANQISSTSDVVSKGNEFELNLNPSRHWTVAASATDTRSFNSNVSTDIETYVAQRMPIWTTIRDQRTGQLWWNTNYGGTQTAAQNYAVFSQTPFNVVRQQEGKSNPQIRRYAWRTSTNYRLAGITENQWLKKVALGGAVRWEDKGAIGYYGLQKLPAVITDLDPNNPIYDKARTYVDLNLSYQTKLFSNKIGTRFQLNVRNVQESGRLQPIAAYPDGTPTAYRIVDPRLFIFTVTFDL